MDALGFGLWTVSTFVAVVLVVAGLHHVRSPMRLVDARTRQQAAGVLPGFTLTARTARAVGTAEIAVGVAAPLSMFASRPAQIVVAGLIALLGAGFALVTYAAHRGEGEDCGCLPLATGETQTTGLPALAVLAAGVGIAAAAAVTTNVDVVGWEIAGSAQGLLAGLWLLLYAAASARVELAPSMAVTR